MKKYECLKQTVGRKRSKENNVWTNMVQRCTNPKRPDYKYYGDRGITVCPEWLNSFGQFLKDMGNCPEGMSLDRIDNAKNYQADNCRWATKDEQMQNTRKTTLITYKGISMGLAAWARKLGLNKESLRIRLLSMSVEEAITKPTKKDTRRLTTKLKDI